nr:hypothetical protein [Tanacetum cinerariifolium]
MRTHSSSNLNGESYPNLTSSNPKRRNRRRSKQPFILEESHVDTMADQRTMAELLRAPTEGYAEAIVVPPILAEKFKPKHSLINMMTSDQFFRLEKDNPHDHIRATRCWLKKEPPHSILTWEDLQTSVVTTAMTAILKQFQATPPSAFVKSVEEIFVTYGGAHPYYQCLAADGNTFPKFQDNIQGYVSAAAVNYNQGNFGYRPPGELKSITTRSGLVLDGPSVPMPPPFINPEEDERVEETLTNQDLAEYTIKVPPPLQDKDEIQIHKFWQMFKQLHINITLADALILILKYQKMLKALLSNKEKLLKLANTPLNKYCSAVILKKSPEKLGGLGKFLIPWGFSELKCKALADLGDSINLMPLSVWKKLGLPELISTRMTLELANRAICTPTGIARDVFVPIGKPFLRTAPVLIDVHKEEMILRDDDKRLTLNMIHDTSSYSNQPQKESINMINIYDDSCKDYLEDLFAINHQSGNPTFSFHCDLTSPEVKDDIFDPEGDIVLIKKLLNLDSTKELPPPHNINLLSGSTTSSFIDNLLEEIFFEVDALPPTNNEEKVFNLGILIHDNLSEVTVQVAPDKNVKKIAISHASLILEDFNPPLYELPFQKEVLGSKTLLSFSFKNKKKVFKPRILTSKGVHTSLLLKLYHRGPKTFKVFKIFESLMEIFP